MVWEFKVLPTIAILAWADRVRVASGYIWLLALSKFVPRPPFNLSSDGESDEIKHEASGLTPELLPDR